jgi:hypothetical protein
MIGDLARASSARGREYVRNKLTKHDNSGTIRDEEATLMETMNIALPEALKLFVQARVSEGDTAALKEFTKRVVSQAN